VQKIVLLRTRILENNGIMGHDIFFGKQQLRVVVHVVVHVVVRVVVRVDVRVD
jgi:hypothetical protein